MKLKKFWSVGGGCPPKSATVTTGISLSVRGDGGRIPVSGARSGPMSFPGVPQLWWGYPQTGQRYPSLPSLPRTAQGVLPSKTWQGIHPSRDRRYPTLTRTGCIPPPQTGQDRPRHHKGTYCHPPGQDRGNPPPPKRTKERVILHHGRYASCSHAGGLSCWGHVLLLENSDKLAPFFLQVHPSPAWKGNSQKKMARVRVRIWLTCFILSKYLS